MSVRAGQAYAESWCSLISNCSTTRSLMAPRSLSHCLLYKPSIYIWLALSGSALSALHVACLVPRSVEEIEHVPGAEATSRAAQKWQERSAQPSSVMQRSRGWGNFFRFSCVAGQSSKVHAEPHYQTLPLGLEWCLQAHRYKHGMGSIENLSRLWRKGKVAG